MSWNGASIAAFEAARLLNRPVEFRDRETEGAIWWQRFGSSNWDDQPLVFACPHWLVSVRAEVATRYGRMLARSFLKSGCGDIAQG